MPVIEILSPRVEGSVSGAPIARRPAALDGKTLGLLNNNKPNADLLQEHLAALLARRFSLAAHVWKRKPGPSLPAEGLAEWARECDVVISASGD